MFGSMQKLIIFPVKVFFFVIWQLWITQLRKNAENHQKCHTGRHFLLFMEFGMLRIFTAVSHKTVGI